MFHRSLRGKESLTDAPCHNFQEILCVLTYCALLRRLLDKESHQLSQALHLIF